MRIAYATTDLDNAVEAEELAAPFGFFIDLREPRDGLWITTMPVAYDLDYLLLDPPQRQDLLDFLSSTALRRPVAVHSRQLADDEAEALEANGVFVTTRLEPALFAALAGELSRKAPAPDAVPAR